MLPDFICQFDYFIRQPGIPFSEHVPDTFKVHLVLDQHFVRFYLFFRKALHDPILKGGPTTIFADGKSALFGLDLEQFLFINRTSELYELFFHLWYFCTGFL